MLQKLVNAARSKARFLVLTVLAGLFSLNPSLALASEDVALSFTDSDKIYLYVSLGFGLVAVVFAYIIAQWVIAQSCGSDKMQEVGAAIRAGALAYLKRQFATMKYFIAGLAILLAWFFSDKGWDVGGYLAL